MRSTTRDALQALHSGMIGVAFPTYKMIPRPPGLSRILMRGPVVEHRSDLLTLIDFDDLIRQDSEKHTRRGGYSDTVGDDLEARGLAATTHMVDTPYKAFVLTGQGVSVASTLWGRPTGRILVTVGDEDGNVRWLEPADPN